MPLLSRSKTAALIVLLCVTTATAAEPTTIPWNELRSVDNSALELTDSPWKVICFLGAECPLARLYGPRLNSLAEEFSSQGFTFVGIDSNPQDSPADIEQYIREHRLEFPIVKDATQSLATQLGATRTPEVFVLDSNDQVVYQGRIDDQYEPGLSRGEPTKHDLRDTLAALIAGRPVPQSQTAAVGCLITFVNKHKAHAGSPSPVTFTRDVVPILNQHCVECHRPGEIGPFSLTDYHEVIGWGEMILEVIDQRRMPPWHADPNYGDFVGERLFPTEDRETLATWLEHGMPEGDPQDRPASPQWAAGWQLPTAPNVEFTMRDRPFVVPADGIVEYQYFVVDPQWEEDHWVRAAQVIPGDASVVHHTIVFVRPPDGSSSEGIGWMGGYVPGQRTFALPPGHARRIPAGSKLVFQMHYTPNGKKTTDITRIGVWLADPAEVTHEVVTRVAVDNEFEIPPGSKNHTVDVRLDGFGPEARLLAAMPHMHLRGKSFWLESRSNQSAEKLLSVPHYDFNWQHWYRFESPLDLKTIDELKMQFTFDNSSGNPVNPAPNEYVTWGDQTGEEMAVAFFDVAYPIGASQRPPKKPRSDADRAAQRRHIQQSVDKFLADMDQDGDGIVTRDEAPVTFQRYGFRRMDRNRDGRLERSEIEAAAARRL